MKESSQAQHKERREFFRIDDEIALQYKIINEDEKNSSDPQFFESIKQSSLSRALDSLSQESKTLMRRLERDQPDSADYLRLLENKVDVLARSIMLQNVDFGKVTARNVNLSATGIAFECDDNIQKDSVIEIQLLLPSSVSVIVAKGHVVYCQETTESQADFPYYVAVEYDVIEEDDKELLIKHVVKRQMQQLRDRKHIL